MKIFLWLGSRTGYLPGAGRAVSCLHTIHHMIFSVATLATNQPASSQRHPLGIQGVVSHSLPGED